MNSQEASTNILEIVQRVTEQAKKAENQYDDRAWEIQRKASERIDLYGGSATRRVSELALLSKTACDDLYSSYQMLVEYLDQQCRPLLAYHPSLEAIESVLTKIQWLNEESKISNNYSASFNNVSIGDVASVQYTPSLNNTMIQRFWENTYDMDPEVQKAKQDREKRIAEEKAKKEEEARRKEEERKEQERKEREKELEEKKRLDLWKEELRPVELAYEADLTAFRNACNEIDMQISKEVDEKVSAEEKHIVEVAADFRDHAVAKYTKQIEELEEKIKICEERMATLGIFKGKEKKACKEEIDNNQTEIFLVKRLLDNEAAKYDEIVKNAGSQASEKRIGFKQEIQDKYSYPKQPQKPVEIEEYESALEQFHKKCKQKERKKKKTVTNGAEPVVLTHTQKENNRIKQEILEVLKQEGNLMTISDIVDALYEDCTNQKVSALVRQLIADGFVEKEVTDRMSYFRYVE